MRTFLLVLAGWFTGTLGAAIYFAFNDNAQQPWIPTSQSFYEDGRCAGKWWKHKYTQFISHTDDCQPPKGMGTPPPSFGPLLTDKPCPACVCDDVPLTCGDVEIWHDDQTVGVVVVSKHQLRGGYGKMECKWVPHIFQTDGFVR